MISQLVQFTTFFIFSFLNFYFIIFQMLCESTWKKQQSILEEDANNLSILKKEINKQTEIDTSVQINIREKIESLKQNAAILAKRLENEKHKNNQLDIIIRYIQTTMEKDKLQEANHKEDVSYESIANLDNKYKKTEYDLGQVNGKVNRLAQNVEQKRIKINQNRTERVIDSGIFRNIEKQLIDSQLNFKKLLIEKVKYEREYEKLLTQYKNLKQKAQIYVKNTGNRVTKFSNEGKYILNSNSNLDESLANIKFTKLAMAKTSPHATLKYIEGEVKTEGQKQMLKIQRMLIQTGLDSCESLLYHFHHIKEITDRQFNEINIFADQSNEIEKYLKDIENLKKTKYKHFYKTKKSLNKQQICQNECKLVKDIIDITQNETAKQIDEFNKLFSESTFADFIKTMQIQQSEVHSNTSLDINKIETTLQQLQKKMQCLLHPAEKNTQKNYLKSQSTGRENIDEIMNKVKKSDQFGKIMKKVQFQQQYRKIVKNNPLKSLSNKALLNRKSIECFKK